MRRRHDFPPAHAFTPTHPRPVASGVGVNLRRLSVALPGPHYFGSDVSKLMTALAYQRCGNAGGLGGVKETICTTAQFALENLQQPNATSRVLRSFPPQRPPIHAFDIVLVPDVLHRVWWADYPPALLEHWKASRDWSRVVAAQRRLVVSLAR